MIAFGRKAAAAGVDAMQVYSIDMGHGVLPSARELEAFYREVLEAVEIPIVLATHESAGYKPSLDLLSRLVADYDQIIGINCTHADLDYLVRVIDELDPRLEIHIGATQQAFACLALGGTGFMAGEGNLAPKLYRSVTALYEQGDIAGAAQAFAKVCRVYAAANASFGSIRGVKGALAALGLPGGPCRSPMLPLSDAERPALDRLLSTVAGIPLDDL
jgi:4-hydroxy-tetrahydrodipicolinate synthase